MATDLLNISPQLIVLSTTVIVLCLEMARLPRAALWALVVGMLTATGVAVDMLGTDTTAFFHYLPC